MSMMCECDTQNNNINTLSTSCLNTKIDLAAEASAATIVNPSPTKPKTESIAML
jgi:hypothetical protein